MTKKISLFSLVLLIVAAIDSIRNLPATAVFGSSLIFFYLFSALVFLIPVALVAAEFSSRYANQGGVFYWIRNAFGEKMALVAIWLQWINTMVWFPTILSFLAGCAAYLVDPDLAQDREFLLGVSLSCFWTLTFINLKGINVSARINSFCGLFGLLIPMIFLIVLGMTWMALGKPLQVNFSYDSILPSFGKAQNWVSLIAVMGSFLGMELAGVHVNDIREPQTNFPKALFWSVFILLVTMILGSLSIAVMIPANEIRLVDGVMQTFTRFFAAFGIAQMTPLLTVLIIIGIGGGMINWILSPAKGLLHAAEHEFLPHFFARKNEHDVPVNLLIAQALIVTLFCFLMYIMPSINAFYWLLTALSTSLYMIMYVLLFAAALKLGRPKEKQTFRIPRGVRRLFCFLGFFSCGLTILVSFFPPPEIDMGGAYRYSSMVALGSILLLAPVWVLMRRKG